LVSALLQQSNPLGQRNVSMLAQQRRCISAFLPEPTTTLGPPQLKV
jgi:hypothetical protein